MTKDNINKNEPPIVTNIEAPGDTTHLEQQQNKLSALGTIMLKNKVQFHYVMLSSVMAHNLLYYNKCYTRHMSH